MPELIKNEIGDNKISEKIGKIDWLEVKIKESYKEIYETKGELQDLKGEVTKNLSGKQLKEMLENELTVDHVKHVLQNVVKKFNEKKDKETFMSIYNEMGAGLIFNLQLALAKLGGKFKMGIDGMYGNRDTRLRVLDFQKRWNDLHCNDGQHGTPDEITLDGWAGIETIKRILLALDDTTWDPSKMDNFSTLPKSGKKSTKKGGAEEHEEEEKPKTKEEWLKELNEKNPKATADEKARFELWADALSKGLNTFTDAKGVNYCLDGTELCTTDEKVYEKHMQEKAEKLMKEVKEKNEKKPVETKDKKAPVIDTTKAPVIDTTKAPVIDTTKKPVIDTTKAPVIDTTKAPVIDTTKAPVIDTTKAPVIDTTKAPVIDTTKAPTPETKAEKEGAQIITYPNGNVYEGKLVNGKPDGVAMVTFMGKRFGTEWKEGILKRMVFPGNNGFYINRTIDLAKVSTVEQLYPDADKNPFAKVIAKMVKAAIVALPITAPKTVEPQPVIDTTKKPVIDTTKTPVIDTNKTPAIDTTGQAPVIDTTHTPTVDTTNNAPVVAPEQPKAPEGYTNVEKANAPAELQAVYDYILKQWPGEVAITSKDGKYFVSQKNGENVRIYLSTEKVDTKDTDGLAFKLYEDGSLYFGDYNKDGGRNDRGRILYKNGNFYNNRWENDKMDGGDYTTITLFGRDYRSDREKGKIVSIKINSTKILLGADGKGTEVDLGKITNIKDLFSDMKPEDKAKAEKAVDDEAKKFAELPAKYEAVAVEMQKIFDDKKKSVYERYSAIEDKVQNALDGLRYPDPNSNFAKIREQITQEAVKDIQNITFPKSGSDEQIMAQYNKLVAYADYSNQLGQWFSVQAQPYIHYFIASAFQGTNVDTTPRKTKGGKEYPKFTMKLYSDGLYLHSHRQSVYINISDNTVGYGLDIKFKDRNEAIRVANLINKIKSEFLKSNKKYFKLSPTNEIEQQDAGTPIAGPIIGAWATDKNILTNYDEFPSLKGKENNENKKKLVDYLNKTLGIKNAPAAK